MIQFEFESDEAVIRSLTIITHLQNKGFSLSSIGIDRPKAATLIDLGKQYIDRLDVFVAEVEEESSGAHLKSSCEHANYTKRIVGELINRFEKCLV